MTRSTRPAKRTAAQQRALAERVRDSTRGGEEIVSFLLRTMRSEDVQIKDRTDAAKVLLDRGWGRSAEHVTISAGDGADHALAAAADAALEALAMRLGSGPVVAGELVGVTASQSEEIRPLGPDRDHAPIRTRPPLLEDVELRGCGDGADAGGAGCGDGGDDGGAGGGSDDD